jgi:hypothetical protein
MAQRTAQLPDDLRERLSELFEELQAVEKDYAAGKSIGLRFARLARRAGAWIQEARGRSF